MNTNSTLFFARDHAAELLEEADRERLARQAQGNRAADRRNDAPPATSRWNFLRGLRAGVPSR
jgi:regulator of protease activity HflC (stomatin/prohibitin superfamily)